tara:strand:- start:114 stop:1397 length:1284 start_codon:yes stop_codon:yes gene_type:complete
MKRKVFFGLLVLLIFILALKSKQIYRMLPYDARIVLKENFNWSIDYMKYSVFYLNYKDFPETALINLDFDKIRLLHVTNALDGGRKAVGYIDIYNDKIIIVSGYGKFSYINKKDITQKSKQVEIRTNLKKIIKDDLFFLKKSPSLFEDISPDDLLIHEDHLYMSYSKKIGKSCYNTSIIKAKLDLTNLIFKDFFTYPDCVNLDRSNRGSFNSQKNGGRMSIIRHDNKKKLLLTTGTFGNKSAAQDNNSHLGKVLLIDLNGYNSSIYAKGLRNQQGLVVVKGNIITSSHGPIGGDELNNIKLNQNYGWPIASYGTSYGNKVLYKKNHDQNGFVEPIYSFVPAVGVSQLINVKKNFNILWNNNILLTTLKGESIFRLTMDKNYTRIISKERIIVNERIRDIVYDDDTKSFYLLLEDSGSLGVLRNKEDD